MIPKIIHYCWISGEDNMPDDIKKCIESWHKYLPDYEFINWNDSNFDWNISEFTKQCRKNNSYAFCSDYIRVWAIYNYGGFYLDTDVEVFKSFDELLPLHRVVTNEKPYMNGYLETAIIGGEKGDMLLGKVVDFYNTLDTGYDWKGLYRTSPDVFTELAKKYCNVNYTPFLISSDTNKTLNVLDWKYFSGSYDFAFAEHKFKNSWCREDNGWDIGKEHDLSIFVCAHKPFDTSIIPDNKHYTIISQSREVKDDNHNVIYIDDDSFTKTHNKCYSEGCAIRYLYNHPELLPSYVGINHYRRYFVDFFNRELFISHFLEKGLTIRQHPFDHASSDRKNNKGAMFNDHPKKEAKAFVDSVKEAAPEYWDTFQELLNDNLQYGCNILIMKKEDFLEMCELCFRVLDYYDKKQGFKNNTDVLHKILKYEREEDWIKFDVEWQARLQGFWLEFLTELYARQKYGVKNMYLSKVGI